MFAGQPSVTSKIGKYVHQLIRSFADNKMKTCTFRDGADFIQQLYAYAYDQRRLKPTTLFCTLHITNMYTSADHQTMVDTVTSFLQENSANNKVNHVSIMTIKNLLQLFLYNNIFSYDNRVYSMTKGSPRTMPLSETLANIYLSDWQRMIMRQVQQHVEIFGR